MPAPYLGPIRTWWCPECNVPVLKEKCPSCRSRAEKLKVTPPGEIKFASEKEIRMINRVIEEKFGVTILRNELVLLNKLPATDKAYEVIVNGRRILQVHFLPESGWIPKLKPEGGQLIYNLGGRGWIIADGKASESIVSKGVNLMAPGVTDAHPSLKVGDEVYVLNPAGRVIATGTLKEVWSSVKRGVVVKVRDSWEADDIFDKESSLEAAVEANEPILKEEAELSVSFIQKTLSFVKKDVTVAFSGGKDSLIVLDLVSEVIDPKVIFTDTGIEYPETVKYVKSFSGDYDILVADAEDGFWRGFEILGPPARDYRWCCKVCKLGPTNKLLKEVFPDGCITFVGQRRYESSKRAKQRRIFTNPWIPLQIGASPIRNWSSLQVWLYISWKGLRINPLYLDGFDRVGCWPCPSSDMWDFEMLKERHPNLLKKLENELSKFLPEEDIKSGNWRFLRKRSPLKFWERNLERWISLLSNDYYSKRFNNLLKSIRKNSESIRIDHRLSLRDEREILWILAKAVSCLGCGSCLGKCPTGALGLGADGKIEISEHLCTGCGKCLRPCPLIDYSEVHAWTY